MTIASSFSAINVDMFYGTVPQRRLTVTSLGRKLTPEAQTFVMEEML